MLSVQRRAAVEVGDILALLVNGRVVCCHWALGTLNHTDSVSLQYANLRRSSATCFCIDVFLRLYCISDSLSPRLRLHHNEAWHRTCLHRDCPHKTSDNLQPHLSFSSHTIHCNVSAPKSLVRLYFDIEMASCTPSMFPADTTK